MAPMKNLKPTDWSSERRAHKIDFHRTLCLWGFNIQMNIEHIFPLNIFLMYTFELIWLCLTMPDQAQLICDSLTKNHLNTSTDYWDIWISGILHNLIGREYLGKQLKTYILQDMDFGMESHITTIFFLDCFKKKHEKILKNSESWKKYKMHCFLQILDCHFLGVKLM